MFFRERKLQRRVDELGQKRILDISALLHLHPWVEIIKIVTRKYSIPFLDMMQEGGLAPRVAIHQELYMPDGLHPNDAGHGRISARLKGFLQSL